MGNKCRGKFLSSVGIPLFLLCWLPFACLSLLRSVGWELLLKMSSKRNAFSLSFSVLSLNPCHFSLNYRWKFSVRQLYLPMPENACVPGQGDNLFSILRGWLNTQTQWRIDGSERYTWRLVLSLPGMASDTLPPWYPSASWHWNCTRKLFHLLFMNSIMRCRVKVF